MCIFILFMCGESCNLQPPCSPGCFLQVPQGPTTVRSPAEHNRPKGNKQPAACVTSPVCVHPCVLPLCCSCGCKKPLLSSSISPTARPTSPTAHGSLCSTALHRQLCACAVQSRVLVAPAHLQYVFTNCRRLDRLDGSVRRGGPGPGSTSGPKEPRDNQQGKQGDCDVIAWWWHVLQSIVAWRREQLLKRRAALCPCHPAVATNRTRRRPYTWQQQRASTLL